VQAEAAATSAADTIAAAEGLLAGAGEELLARVVLHVQRLLGCSSLQGVIPAMNQLYVKHSELANGTRAVVSLLGLPERSGVGACLGRLRQLLGAEEGEGQAA
jgi:hypothetical protein